MAKMQLSWIAQALIVACVLHDSVAIKKQESVVSLAVSQPAGPNKSPVQKVIEMLIKLSQSVRTDGVKEQMSYDRYACWCEDTMKRKAADISAAKDEIEDLNTEIVKLSGSSGTYQAVVAGLKKEIAENIASTKEATEMRNRENREYEEEKVSAEQCIGGLEMAIKVLTGAGEKGGFLQLSERMQETKLLGVVDGVRSVLSNPIVTQSITDDDMQVVKHFITKPSDFIGGRKAMSAAQVDSEDEANPAGDYAPQSGQIQGILKGMYEAFTMDIEKSNGEEAEKQKQFERLIETKTKELARAKENLQKQLGEQAEAKKKLVSDRGTREDLKEQLRADETFFKSAKAGCQAKAKAWAKRSKGRVDELKGIKKAQEILSQQSDEGVVEKNRFNKYAYNPDSLLQVSAVAAKNLKSARTRASRKLSSLAHTYRRSGMARLALEVKSTWHFDKVIGMVGGMMKDLRREEQDDVKHRDKCQSKISKNSNKIEDLGDDLNKAEEHLGRRESQAQTAERKLSLTKNEILETKKEMEQLLQDRDEEHADFLKEDKDDAENLVMLKLASDALSGGLSLVQVHAKAKNDEEDEADAEDEQPEGQQNQPEYTVDPDMAPETGGFDKEYKSGGAGNIIISLLDTIQEDIKNEVKEARKADKEGEEQYVKQKADLQKSIEAQTDTKVQLEKELNELKSKISMIEEKQSQLNGELSNQQDEQQTIKTDCNWIYTHFQKRRDQRKAEMDGLNEAKEFLAGVVKDQDAALLQSGQDADNVDDQALAAAQADDSDSQ